LEEPSEGEVLLKGTDLTRLSRRQMRPHRQRLQVVFQDPYASLNPKMKAGRILAEPLRNFGKSRIEARDQVNMLLNQVGLRSEDADKYPHEFSGGQRQRIGIARALALDPEVMVCDEAVSALDVSVQAQIINLLRRLQEHRRVAYLFISHDLGIVKHISHRVAVMYLGKIVEIGDRSQVFRSPLHPYTRALIQSAPIADPSKRPLRQLIEGEVPSAVNPPAGCRFRSRCPHAMRVCAEVSPRLAEVEAGHATACHLYETSTSPLHS